MSKIGTTNALPRYLKLAAMGHVIELLPHPSAKILEALLLSSIQKIRGNISWRRKPLLVQECLVQ
jgi:hypothetical protein